MKFILLPMVGNRKRDEKRNTDLRLFPYYVDSSVFAALAAAVAVALN